MRVQLNYFAQIRQAAGVESLTLHPADGATLTQVLALAAAKHGNTFRQLILSESNQLRPSLILLLNGVPIGGGSDPVLKESDTLSLFSPVAGG